MTAPGARILAETRDPYATTDEEHLAYQRRNRARGRMSGQIRMRVRHRSYRTPWFDYLLASPDEMAELAEGTGWHLSRTISDGPELYVGVLEK